MSQKRARDPGLKIDAFGKVTWVHCPKCDGPAKYDAFGATCLRCGYMTIQKIDAGRSRWARIRGDDPRCVDCRNPLPQQSMPTAREKDGEIFVRLKCPTCAVIADYRGQIGFPPAGASNNNWIRLQLYLVTQVGGRTLSVNNLAHLDAISEYLGATMRERGPVRGLTMMARLPAWMKSATMRDKVLRGLKKLRDLAVREGIDE